MGDSAGHLAERAQTLLLHELLLGLAQVVVRLLQGAVQLGVTGGEGHVLAELAEELALGAGEPR